MESHLSGRSLKEARVTALVACRFPFGVGLPQHAPVPALSDSEPLQKSIRWLSPSFLGIRATAVARDSFLESQFGIVLHLCVVQSLASACVG